MQEPAGTLTTVPSAATLFSAVCTSVLEQVAALIVVCAFELLGRHNRRASTPNIIIPDFIHVAVIPLRRDTIIAPVFQLYGAPENRQNTLSWWTVLGHGTYLYLKSAVFCRKQPQACIYGKLLFVIRGVSVM